MFKINLLTNNLQNVYEHLNKDVQDRATKHQMKAVYTLTSYQNS